MKIEPIINFMHAVQYQVNQSDICDNVSFGANDEYGYLDIRFRCKYVMIPTDGLTCTSYISRQVSYDELIDENSNTAVMAKELINNIERIIKGEQ